MAINIEMNILNNGNYDVLYPKTNYNNIEGNLNFDNINGQVDYDTQIINIPNKNYIKFYSVYVSDKTVGITLDRITGKIPFIGFYDVIMKATSSYTGIPTFFKVANNYSFAFINYNQSGSEIGINTGKVSFSIDTYKLILSGVFDKYSNNTYFSIVIFYQ